MVPLIGYTDVEDDRGPLGDPFPYVIIFDEDGGSIRLGSEQFSTANFLKQKIFTITDNFKLYKGLRYSKCILSMEFWRI